MDFPRYPVAAFAPSGGVVALIEEARTATGLPLRRDAAITAVGFDPRPLGSTELGEAIIPLTNQLVLTVTIINQGNERLTDIDVDVQLLGDRAGTSAREAMSFEFLVPGESSTFEVTFDVVPVVQYELRVTVPGVSGEAELENNVFTERFVVNQES